MYKTIKIHLLFIREVIINIENILLQNKKIHISVLNNNSFCHSIKIYGCSPCLTVLGAWAIAIKLAKILFHSPTGKAEEINRQ